MPRTRFAPSPTGYLHLGHAYSALLAKRSARDGLFLLRVEDIDPVRCSPEFTTALYEDLHWLGLSWPEPVRRQSEHIADYTAALDKLKSMGLVYPCFCTRREVEQEAIKAAHAPHAEDGTPYYPGTCRSLSAAQRAEKMRVHSAVNWRLNVTEALRLTGDLYWHDRARGKIKAQPELFGDVVLARKDVPTSYHLSVTVDDHLQKIDLVTRGQDLFSSTHVHRLLQALLGYETPDYFHHDLMTDESGRRYAKRDRSATLRSMREQGLRAEDICAKIDAQIDIALKDQA